MNGPERQTRSGSFVNARSARSIHPGMSSVSASRNATSVAL